MTEQQKKQIKQNKRYWEKREEKALKYYLEQETTYEQRVEKIYRNMLDNVQKEINSFYGKYADKENITMSEAKKRVSKLDIKAYERKAEKYVKDASLDRKANGGKTNKKGYYFSPEVEEEMRIYNLTMKINRLEMLKANIGLELIEGHSELDSFMEEILQGRTLDELKRQAGVLGKTVGDSVKTAQAIANNTYLGATFSQRIWGHQQVMKSEIDRLIQVGMIQGRNPRVLAKDIEKYFIGEPELKNGKKGAKFRAETLMRTELARVQTEAQKQSYERNNFSEYMYHTNSGCCDICRELNGKPFKVSEMVIGENAPPLHPRCRCSTSAYFSRESYEELLRFIDNGGTIAEWDKMKKSNIDKSKKSGIMKLPGMYCYGDYLRDVLGSAIENNVDEYNFIKADIESKGGQLILLDDNPKMVCNIQKGKPGIIEVDKNISIGGLKHEYRHFLKDIEMGNPGLAFYLQNEDEYFNFELQGYEEELKIAKDLKNAEVIKKIEREIEQRKSEIYGE